MTEDDSVRKSDDSKENIDILNQELIDYDRVDDEYSLFAENHVKMIYEKENAVS